MFQRLQSERLSLDQQSLSLWTMGDTLSEKHPAPGVCLFFPEGGVGASARALGKGGTLAASPNPG